MIIVLEEEVDNILEKLNQLRLEAIDEAGLRSVYDALCKMALDHAGGREEHDRLQDLCESLELGVPYGVHEREWKRKLVARGFKLSQDEFHTWAEAEIAKLPD